MMDTDLRKDLGETKVLKRCPKCHSLSVNFDTEQQKISCSKCGFEQQVMQ